MLMFVFALFGDVGRGVDAGEVVGEGVRGGIVPSPKASDNKSKSILEVGVNNSSSGAFQALVILLVLTRSSLT